MSIVFLLVSMVKVCAVECVKVAKMIRANIAIIFIRIAFKRLVMGYYCSVVLFYNLKSVSNSANHEVNTIL